MFASLQLVPGNFDCRKDIVYDMFTYDMQFTARPYFSYSFSFWEGMEPIASSRWRILPTNS